MSDTNTPISLGLIGVGFHARTVHIPAIDLVDEIRLTAIATSRPETAAQAGRRYRTSAYGDYRELLARADVEAVLISTPWDTHETITRDALAAGKHVFIETPGIRNSQAAEQLLNTAREKRLVAQVGFLTRYSPAFDLLKSHLDRHRPPRLFTYEYFSFLAHQYNLASYLSDASVERVLAATRSPAGTSATLRFDNGDTAVVIGRSLANCSVDIESVRVSTGSFYAAVDGRRRVRIIDDMKSVAVSDWSVSSSGGKTYEPQPFAGRFLEQTGAAPQLRAFAAAVRGGPAPRSTLADAIETQRLMDQIDSLAQA